MKKFGGAHLRHPRNSAEIEDSDDETLIFSLDADVLCALFLTFVISLFIIVRAIQGWIRFRRDTRRSEASVAGLSAEQLEQRRANAQRRIDEAMQETEHDCAICLAAAEFPVLTDCGHLFCCGCIIEYWRHSRPIVSPCECAMCRSTFHMLLPCQWPQRGSGDDGVDDRIHEANMRIDDYNRRFSNNRPWLDYLRDIPVLIPYMFRNFFNNDIFTLVSQIRVGFVFICLLIYLLLPTDMVPESVYGILGFLDDCVVAVVVVSALIRWLRNYMADRGLAPRD